VIVEALPDRHGPIGEWKFNQISFRPDKHKAKSELIILEVPALIGSGWQLTSLRKRLFDLGLEFLRVEWLDDITADAGLCRREDVRSRHV
jgi:hypothetical protein